MVVDRLIDFGSRRGNVKLTTAFESAAAASVTDNQAPHHTRRIRHESCAVGERGPLTVSYLNVCLVQKRSGSQAHWCPLPGKLALGNPVKFGIKGSE